MFQKTLKNESLHRSQSDGLFTSIFKLNNRLLFIDKVEKKNISQLSSSRIFHPFHRDKMYPFLLPGKPVVFVIYKYMY